MVEERLEAIDLFLSQALAILETFFQNLVSLHPQLYDLLNEADQSLLIHGTFDSRQNFKTRVHNIGAKSFAQVCGQISLFDDLIESSQRLTASGEVSDHHRQVLDDCVLVRLKKLLL